MLTVVMHYLHSQIYCSHPHMMHDHVGYALSDGDAMIVGRATCIIRTNMVDMVTLCSLHPSKVHTPRIYKYPAAASI